MDQRQSPGYPPQSGQDQFAPPQVQSPYAQPLNPQPYSPNVQPTPQYGEGLPPNLSYPWDPQEQQQPRRKRRVGRWIALVAALLIVAVLVRGLIFMGAISTEPLWSVHLAPVGEANVLVLGYGGEGHEGAYLTDSLLLLHMGSGGTAQISIPRDLWVQIPPDSGQYAKINYAYAYGRGEAGDPVAGGQLATHKVEQVTGLSTDRWVTI